MPLFESKCKKLRSIEIISLIYRSVDYLRFIRDQLCSELCEVDGWDVAVRIVANDPTPEVVSELEKGNIPYSIFRNIDPGEFYLNRVYRAYNWAIESSKHETVCLVNSDQAFSPGWLGNLLKHHDGVNIPCSRLVESGKMESGLYGINITKYRDGHFGRSPLEFNQVEWIKYAEEIKCDKIERGGLYMPCILDRARVVESGFFPEGNLFREHGETVVGYPNDRVVWKSGDDFYFNEILGQRYNMKHVTVFDSVVYHIQEGEKDG